MSEPPLSPFWGTFALFRDQLERLVALNLFWGLLLVPGAIGLAYPSLPLLVRTVLMGLSTLLAVPGSLAVYTVVAKALSGNEITFPETWRTFRQGAAGSFRTLAPLYLLLGSLLWLNLLWLPFVVLLALRLLLLFVLCASLFWGPLAAQTPSYSAFQLFRTSLELLFSYPARTVWTALVSLLLLVAGTVSVGGLVLVAFVLLASYQTLVLYGLKG